MLSTVRIYKTDNLNIESSMYVKGKKDDGFTWDSRYPWLLTIKLSIMVNGKLKNITILEHSPTYLTPKKEHKIDKEKRQDDEVCKQEMVKLLPTWEQIDACDGDCLKVNFSYAGVEKLTQYLNTLDDLWYKMWLDIFARIDQHIIATYKTVLDVNSELNHQFTWVEREREAIRKEYEDFRIAEVNREFGLKNN